PPAARRQSAPTPSSARSCLLNSAWRGLRFRQHTIAQRNAARLLVEFLPAHAKRAQSQRVEPDEALGVLLVVGALVVLEGHKRGGIQRFHAFAAGHQHVALVELEPHLALDVLLAL